FTTQRVLLNGCPHVRHASATSSQVSPHACVGGHAGSPTHWPSSQWSFVVQNSWSSQEALLATLPQLPAPSQTSSVHGLPSLWHGVPCGALQLLVSSLHVAEQTGCVAH